MTSPDVLVPGLACLVVNAGLVVLGYLARRNRQVVRDNGGPTYSDDHYPEPDEQPAPRNGDLPPGMPNADATPAEWDAWLDKFTAWKEVQS